MNETQVPARGYSVAATTSTAGLPAHWSPFRPVLVLSASAGESPERRELAETLRMLTTEFAEPRSGSQIVIAG